MGRSNNKDHVVVTRFSAMGDVAMTIPVVYNACRAYPDTHFTMLTKQSMKTLFVNKPDNLNLVAIDTDKYKGAVGLLRLFKEIDSRRKIDCVADLHDVIRTKVFRMIGRFHGAEVAYIDKGRTQKKNLTRGRHKIMRQLPTSHERYRDVFSRLGFVFEDRFDSLFYPGKGNPELFSELTSPKREGEIWIGIAPFAAHKGKIYPLDKMEKVVSELNRRGTRLFFFGGGEEERRKLKEWTDKYAGSVSLAEKRYGFALELALQSYLDAMICMDSGNMHLASLAGVSMISIWGATHPYCGFTAMGQDRDLIVEKDIDCRPCSVFGNKPCRKGDYRCMNSIAPEEILSKLYKLLPQLNLKG